MSLADPLADMLTCIRNAVAVGHKKVSMPHSKMKGEIARVMKSEGFVKDFVVEGGLKKTLTVYLKYMDGYEPSIRGLQRYSKSGLRKYCGASDIPRVLGGLGVAILSTSSGILSDKEAREKHVGGEVLCTIW
jgi:small subunit ribosomal protein S8